MPRVQHFDSSMVIYRMVIYAVMSSIWHGGTKRGDTRTAARWLQTDEPDETDDSMLKPTELVIVLVAVLYLCDIRYEVPGFL